MKSKSLTTFPLEKYKYLHFVIGSAFMAFVTVLIAGLLLGEDISLKYLISKSFLYWGVMYPVSFAVFETVKKQYNKAQEKKTE